MTCLPERQLSILTGASGSGKTTLLTQALAALERGDSFPIQFPSSVKTVGMIIADRTVEETQERFRHLGIRACTIYGVADDNTLPLSMLDRPGDLFTEVIKRCGIHDAYILDPIMLFMEGSSIDYKNVAKSLIRMARFVIQNDITLLCTHHTTKTRSDFQFMRPQDRISGSAAFQGYSGTQLVLIEGKEQGLDFDKLVIVPHLSPPEEYRLVRGDDGYFVTQQENAKGILDVLLKMFSGLYMKRQEFDSQAHLLGLSKSEVNDLIESGALVKQGPKGYVQKVGAPC